MFLTREEIEKLEYRCKEKENKVDRLKMIFVVGETAMSVYNITTTKKFTSNIEHSCVPFTAMLDAPFSFHQQNKNKGALSPSTDFNF